MLSRELSHQFCVILFFTSRMVQRDRQTDEKGTGKTRYADK